jgi:hypothetical protein
MRLSHAAIGVVAVLSFPAVASAQTPAGDSVRGTLTFASETPAGTIQETYFAGSGPNGENAGGSVATALLDFGVFLDFDVTCAYISGNRAIIGMRYFEPRILGEISLYRLIVDGGPGGTDAVGESGTTGFPADCATVSIDVDPSLRILSGDAIVTDTKPLPTTKDQCKNGGWRDYSDFGNQGACVSFVRHQARQACLFERAAHGRPAFRAKYGSGLHKRQAMRRCIRERVAG